MLRNTTLLHPGPPHCPGIAEVGVAVGVVVGVVVEVVVGVAVGVAVGEP